ncbi:MAG TPA: 5-formyltetrahydrofolate cyclo-ligase [Myxococcota bacterium]|nr:5-formyltetrahydrofolate cyclo-ligase [Myxococcota bacterium]
MERSALELRKRELRAEARVHAASDRGPQAARCLEALLGLPRLAGPGTLALYASQGDEVPVERAVPLLRARGWRVVFPRIEGDQLALGAAEPGELVAGRFGMREPPPAAPEVGVERVDVFVVPGLLFARDGTRLGRGAGHYDRLLARARADALRIGICYSDRVRDALPSAPHDVPVQLLVTDRGVLRCRAPADAEESR